MNIKVIGVVTAGRSDYGLYQSLLAGLHTDATLRLALYVTGSHLSLRHGMTVKEIKADPWSDLVEEVDLDLVGDSPTDVASAIGAGVSKFAQAYTKVRPHLLIVLGDRFEMLAAVIAALPFAIPIVHIHGGESTEGAIDDAIRHAITKMSHLHFVATQEAYRRVIQMGEEPWRVTVTGAPSLDTIVHLPPLSPVALRQQHNIPGFDQFLLVTYHPVTLEYLEVETHIRELLAALTEVGLPVILTYPNSDTGHTTIIRHIEQWARQHPNKVYVTANLGQPAYATLMRRAVAMVGNSSSGIIEAPSFELPVVNIGNRQAGRLRANNVIDAPCERRAIVAGLRKATSPKFRAGLRGLNNPYGDGHAAERMLKVLRTIPLDARLIQKHFVDQVPASEKPRKRRLVREFTRSGRR